MVAPHDSTCPPMLFSNHSMILCRLAHDHYRFEYDHYRQTISKLSKFWKLPVPRCERITDNLLAVFLVTLKSPLSTWSIWDTNHYNVCIICTGRQVVGCCMMVLCWRMSCAQIPFVILVISQQYKNSSKCLLGSQWLHSEFILVVQDGIYQLVIAKNGLLLCVWCSRRSSHLFHFLEAIWKWNLPDVLP